MNGKILLNGVAGTRIPGIDGFAAGKSFVLPVIVADAVFAQLPAKINFFVVDDRRKIKQPDLQILDDAAGLQNLVERTL
jgi:hypothetical protein